MAEFRMPSLGADMEAGTILKWRVAPGDSVERGAIVAEIETEKAEMEVEIFETGVVEKILVGVGEKVPVGTPLAIVRATGEPPSAAAPSLAPAEPARPERAAPSAAPSPPAHTLPSVPPAPSATPSGRAAPGERQPRIRATSGARLRATSGARLRATPLARRIAEELGVDLARVRGSGEDGAIGADDVRAAAREARAEPGAPPSAETPPVPAPPRAEESRELSRQRVIAALMERAKREIPHYYLSTQIDLTPALTWLETRNRALPVSERILPAALLLRAVVLAVRKTPELNGHYLDGALQAASALHLGVAIALRRGGLLAPAIRDAQAKSLAELMASLRDLGARARSGKLRASEMSSATLTVTSLGDNAADSVQAVIYPPQVAIVGFGTPRLRPWVDGEGGLCVRTVVQASLAADHRVSNGHRGAVFLTALARALAAPEELA